jgi:hypothetical protein
LRNASPLRQRSDAVASTLPDPLQKRQIFVSGRQPLSILQPMPKAYFAPRQSGYVIMIGSSLVARIGPKHLLPPPSPSSKPEMARVGLGFCGAQLPMSAAKQLKKPCQSETIRLGLARRA